MSTKKSKYVQNKLKIRSSKIYKKMKEFLLFIKKKEKSDEIIRNINLLYSSYDKWCDTIYPKQQKLSKDDFMITFLVAYKNYGIMQAFALSIADHTEIIEMYENNNFKPKILYNCYTKWMKESFPNEEILDLTGFVEDFCYHF